MRKTLLFVFIPILLSSCGNSPIPSVEPEKLISYSDEVRNIRALGQVTGADSISKTTEMTVGGCDLGYPLYDDDTGIMYNFYGDTFSDPHQVNQWRSNTISLSTDTDLSDGFTIDSFISSSSGFAIPAIEGKHMDKYEMTKIPTGVVKVKDAFYMFYFSKYSWNVPSTTSMNYGGVVKSIDKGQNWERVFDLTWVDHATDDPKKEQNSVEEIQKLINQNAFGLPAGDVDIKHHEAYRFTSIFPYDGNDGYVYLFCMGGYRSSQMSFARVSYDNFEIFDEYEYLVGYKDNVPQYKKGREGLDYLKKNNEDGYCLETRTTEFSVMYSKYLKRYVIVMPSSANPQRRNGVTLFTSKNIYGPYKTTGILTLASNSELLPHNVLYAPMVHDNWQSEDGKKFYLFASHWIPYYNPRLYEIEFN